MYALYAEAGSLLQSGFLMTGLFLQLDTRHASGHCLVVVEMLASAWQITFADFLSLLLFLPALLLPRSLFFSFLLNFFSSEVLNSASVVTANI